MKHPPEFCSHCGSRLSPAGWGGPRMCNGCGACHHCGPALLVLVLVFARERLLLQKRGVEPYRGSWAPPGGFVEWGESLEAAAIREVWEEVRVKLTGTQLLPHGVVSVPKINQVYHIFIARLEQPVPAAVVRPESLEVGWFSYDELTKLNIWEPGVSLDMRVLFEGIRLNRRDFYQQNEHFSRLLNESNS